MSLSREQILALGSVVEPETADVPVPPAWGDKWRVRSLTARERLEFARMQQKALDGEAAAEPTSYLVTLATIDNDGKRVLQGQDSDALADIPGGGKVLNDIAEKVMDLSGLGDDAVEDAEGNSDATQSGDSDSNSPSDSESPSQS